MWIGTVFAAACCLQALFPGARAAHLATTTRRFGANPIIEDGPDLADPAVLEYEDKLYLYPTGDQSSYRVYVLDLKDAEATWQKGPVVFTSPRSCWLAKLPGLGEGSLTWAPHVIYHSASNKFYLYYSICLEVGVAESESAEGPFRDVGVLQSWAIDAMVLQDGPEGGSNVNEQSEPELYLYYASINLLRIFSGEEAVWGQKLASPTKLADEKAVLLAEPDQDWEFGRASMLMPRGINEGPWVTKMNSTYYLMYSGAGANSETYRVGYATSTSPLGPYTKYAHNPIIQPNDPAEIGIFGPGHNAVWRDRSTGRHWAFYHQKRTDGVGWDRYICVDELKISADGMLSLKVTKNRQVQPLVH
eukprot:gb/GFBE01056228.1/.p1 GENE.gb/GFBE01056228.1/~~gb/GFBE01056228.1/.p1  ORF type:complete len:360 (+),score=33.17 gb/GFBE01056228.1/:1-1080(+)